MYTCSKCHELIGDRVEVCPFCRTPVPAEACKQAEHDYNTRKILEDIEAVNEYHKRTIRGIIVLAVSIPIIILVICYAIIYSNQELSWLPMLSLIPFIGMLVALGLVRFNRCPHCEHFLGKQSIRYQYCPICGGKIRDYEW